MLQQRQKVTREATARVMAVRQEQVLWRSMEQVLTLTLSRMEAVVVNSCLTSTSLPLITARRT